MVSTNMLNKNEGDNFLSEVKNNIRGDRFAIIKSKSFFIDL